MELHAIRSNYTEGGWILYTRTYLAFVVVVRFDIGAIQLTYRGGGEGGKRCMRRYKGVQGMEEERGNEGK